VNSWRAGSASNGFGNSSRNPSNARRTLARPFSFTNCSKTPHMHQNSAKRALLPSAWCMASPLPSFPGCGSGKSSDQSTIGIPSFPVILGRVREQVNEAIRVTTPISRTRPWLALESECRGRRFSIVRGNPDRPPWPWVCRPATHKRDRGQDGQAHRWVG